MWKWKQILKKNKVNSLIEISSNLWRKISISVPLPIKKWLTCTAVKKVLVTLGVVLCFCWLRSAAWSFACGCAEVRGERLMECIENLC